MGKKGIKKYAERKEEMKKKSHVTVLDVDIDSHNILQWLTHYIKPHRRRFSWMIISLTAAMTKRIWLVSVAHVKCV